MGLLVPLQLPTPPLTCNNVNHSDSKVGILETEIKIIVPQKPFGLVIEVCSEKWRPSKLNKWVFR